MTEKRNPIAAQVGTGDRAFAERYHAEMPGRRRSVRRQADHQLISRVRIEVDDFDRLVGREVVILAADRAEVISGGIEDEQIVIGGYAAGVKWIVPLQNELARIGSGGHGHHDRRRSTRVEVLKSAGVKRGGDLTELDVPRAGR